MFFSFILIFVELDKPRKDTPTNTIECEMTSLLQHSDVLKRAQKSSVARECVLEEYDHPFLKYLTTFLQKDSLHIYLVQPFASSSHCSGPMHSRRVWYFQIVDHGLPEELNNQMMREAIGNIHLRWEASLGMRVGVCTKTSFLWTGESSTPPDAPLETALHGVLKK